MDKILNERGISLYGGLLEVNNDGILIYDNEQRSSLILKPTMENLKEAYLKNSDYFSDNILISIYHFIQNGFMQDIYDIVEDLSEDIKNIYLARKYNIHLDLNSGDIKKWHELFIEDFISFIGNRIRKKVNI